MLTVNSWPLVCEMLTISVGSSNVCEVALAMIACLLGNDSVLVGCSTMVPRTVTLMFH